MKSSIYTGKLQYKGIYFFYVFDGKELRLISPETKKDEIKKWFLKPIENGKLRVDNRLKLDVEFLIGDCNETNNKVVFFTQKDSYIECLNLVFFIEVRAFIINKYDRKLIDRISFISAEIDCIHPVTEAFEFSLEIESFTNNGTCSVTAKDFDSTTTTRQNFIVDNNEVQVSFAVSRKIGHKIGEPPMSLNSTMMFYFEPTSDYQFIMHLYIIAKQFISFLCYRKNVFFTAIELATPYAGNKHEKFATLYIVDEKAKVEIKTLQRGKFIKQEYISGHEGPILNDIANDLLYTRHIPETYELGRHINAARFVMIISAFEWQFSQIYGDVIPKTEATRLAQEKATQEINILLQNANSRKLKKIYKHFLKLMEFDSLQAKIVKIGKDYNEIIGDIGKQLYEKNGEKLKYSEIGKRLSEQRNHFAHGDLDENFIGNSLLDLVYMEYVIYALQLKYYKVDDDSIISSIQDLFSLPKF